MREIAFAAHMQLNELSNNLGPEEAAPERLIRENSLTQKSRQPAAKPMSNRHAKSHFAPAQILRRQQLSQNALQQVLGCQPAEFHLFRQAGSKLNHLVIQKR